MEYVPAVIAAVVCVVLSYPAVAVGAVAASQGYEATNDRVEVSILLYLLPVLGTAGGFVYVGGSADLGRVVAGVVAVAVGLVTYVAITFNVWPDAGKVPQLRQLRNLGAAILAGVAASLLVAAILGLLPG